MWTFKRTFKEAFDTGGLLLFGLGCLFLFRQHYYPNVFGPLSFGMISVGALGFVRHLTKDLGSRIENSKYEEILLLLEQRQSEIEENRLQLEKLRDACSRFMAMREVLEALQGNNSLTEERTAILANILQPRDVATSRESAEDTPRDVRLESLPGGSPRGTQIRALSEDAVGVMELYQQKQTWGNAKALKEQALQVQLNISSSLKCDTIENYQKEETKKHYLEINEESKQEDQENIREKVSEKYIMKQEDGVLKDMGKAGEDGEKFKLEEMKNLSKNVIQLEKKETLSEEEGDEMKFNVQQEQTWSSTNTLKEQALQVQSNIFDTLQCDVTETHHKEETKKQHLEISDSKDEDLKNVREKVIERDFMKHEYGVLKDMDKIGDDSECKPEEIKNISKNVIQLNEREELEEKESDKLSQKEERSADIASKENQMAKEKCEEELKNF